MLGRIGPERRMPEIRRASQSGIGRDKRSCAVSCPTKPSEPSERPAQPAAQDSARILDSSELARSAMAAEADEVTETAARERQTVIDQIIPQHVRANSQCGCCRVAVETQGRS